MRRVRLVLLSALCLLTWSSLRAAESKTSQRTVTVEGQGKAQAAPDIARLTLGVSQEGPSPEAVSAKVREAITKVLQAVRKQGISDKDIQTQSYLVQPKWDWSGGRQRRAGFTVSDQVAVKVRDLKKVGQIISDATAAGATNVEGPNFDFDNPHELERQALVQAMEDAKAKASALAQAAGAALGEVYSINQAPTAWPGPRPMMARAMSPAAAAAAPEPIEAGEQNFTSNITVSFILR